MKGQRRHHEGWGSGLQKHVTKQRTFCAFGETRRVFPVQQGSCANKREIWQKTPLVTRPSLPQSDSFSCSGDFSAIFAWQKQSVCPKY